MIGSLDIVRVDLGRRLIPYQEGWDLQRHVHAEVVAGERPDTLLLLEHDEIFTAGSRTQPSDRPTDGSAVIEVDRGGRITWHGLGQLVGYPIIRLPQRLDVVSYVRDLEALLIATCADFGVAADRVDGRSGVWVDSTTTDQAIPPTQGSGGPQQSRRNKVAAVGIRVARGVTMHGFALNCDCALDWQERVVACGIADAGVTSLSQITGRTIGVLDAADALERHLRPSGVHHRDTSDAPP